MPEMPAPVDVQTFHDALKLGIKLYDDRWRALMEADHPGQAAAIHLDSEDCVAALDLTAAICLSRDTHPYGLTLAVEIGPRPSKDVFLVMVSDEAIGCPSRQSVTKARLSWE